MGIHTQSSEARGDRHGGEDTGTPGLSISTLLSPSGIRNDSIKELNELVLSSLKCQRRVNDF